MLLSLVLAAVVQSSGAATPVPTKLEGFACAVYVLPASSASRGTPSLSVHFSNRSSQRDVLAQTATVSLAGDHGSFWSRLSLGKSDKSVRPGSVPQITLPKYSRRSLKVELSKLRWTKDPSSGSSESLTPPPGTYQVRIDFQQPGTRSPVCSASATVTLK